MCSLHFLCPCPKDLPMPMNYSTVSLVVESCNPRKGNPAMICTKTRSNNKPGVMSEIFPSLFRHFALGFLSLSPLSTKLASCYSRLAGSGAQIQRGSNKLYRVCLFHKCLRLCGFLAEKGENGPREEKKEERERHARNFSIPQLHSEDFPR